MEPTSKKLLDRVRDAIRVKHYSIRTEQAYVNWIKRYIYFHNVRHPAEIVKRQLERDISDNQKRPCRRGGPRLTGQRKPCPGAHYPFGSTISSFGTHYRDATRLRSM